MRLLPVSGSVLDAELAGLLERYIPPSIQPTTRKYFMFHIPDDPAIRRALWEAMSLPTTDQAWTDEGIGAAAAAAAAAEAIATMFEISMLGMMSFFASQAVPQGWIKMGTTVSVADYPELAEVVPPYWLNDPFNPTHIILPQLAGLSLIPPGHYVETGYSHDYETGESAGEARHTLITAEMPAHTHTQNAHAHTQEGHSHQDAGHTHSGLQYALPNATTIGPGAPQPTAVPGLGNSGTGFASLNFKAPTIASATATNQQTGEGQAHNNMPPYAVFDLYIFAGR